MEAGTADIFFPTDFSMLERMYNKVARQGLASAGGTAHVILPSLILTPAGSHAAHVICKAEQSSVNGVQ